MKSFNEVYEKIYKENFQELENLRKDRMKKTLLIICVAIISLLLINVFFINTRLMETFIFLFAVGLMIFIITNTVTTAKFTNKFKEKIIQPLIKNIDENLYYYPARKLDQPIYMQGEFERYNRYYSEDLIEGILDEKYKVVMAEVQTEYESTDSDGNTTTTTLFHGIFGNVECSKNINTTLKIHSEKGVLGRLFKGRTRIEMDSEEFEKYFDVFGENKIIAMQILTSDVMEMMIDFITNSKIKYEMTIKNNQIYIRFHTGGVFEPKLFKGALNYDMLKKYYNIIYFIFEISKRINKVIEETEI